MVWSPTRVSPAPCSAGLTGRPASPKALPGGTANRGLVLRVGDTVRRPTAPYWQATHALLAHLSAVGFDGAPRVLSVSPATETLTYIDGQAAVPPLPQDTLTDAALVSVADLLRRYHQAAASFDPAGYRWPRPIPVRFRTGLVSHNDVHPANLVFRDGRGAALTHPALTLPFTERMPAVTRLVANGRRVPLPDLGGFGQRAERGVQHRAQVPGILAQPGHEAGVRGAERGARDHLRQ